MRAHAHMESLTEKKLKELELMANRLREDVIEMVSHAGSGHIAGPLGHGGDLHRVVFPYFESRSEEAGLAGSRPAGAFERPHLPGPVCGARACGIFPR